MFYVSYQYNIAKKIITDNKDLLDLIANALLEKETITREEIVFLVKNKRLPKEDEMLSTKKEENEENKETKKNTKKSK
jgi:cell division protease FtsH